MKIVVGGATGVGKSIVGYLSRGNNDIVVVDEDAAKLNEIAKEYDVQPYLGSISHPDVQESVGMKNMDMLIAVTDNDEINMIACQVAFTLFNVPKKIARVDSQYFLNPLWNSLYNEKSLPIDLVITPDIEIAEFIRHLFDFPGSTVVYPFANNQVNIFAFRQKETEVPFMKFSLNHINQKLAELSAHIVMIMRGNRRILPTEEEVFLQRNDLIYVGCFPEQNMEIMRLFGVDHNPYEKIIIFGANTISYYLAKQLENNENIVRCNIVEEDAEKATKLAEKLNVAGIVCGDMMSEVIQQEAGLGTADVSVAVTDRDKDNLLISLIASRSRETQTLSLVNSKDYNVLGLNIRNNVIIDRSVITISAILKYLRRARIREAYSIGRNMGEIWEIKLGEDSSHVGHSVKSLHIPEDSAIMLISRGDKLLFDFADLHLENEDKILIYVAPSDIKRIENIFYS
ncbi:MAG: Trk system potassium transporter TrkA [Alphaproteobacteria bacterium]|nr:Trk system potassium transporter TrkA [Alphaproteobacteria bacterium]